MRVTQTKGKKWAKIANDMNKSISQVYLRFSRLIIFELYDSNKDISFNFNRLIREYTKEAVPIPSKIQLKIVLSKMKYGNDLKLISQTVNLPFHEVQEILSELGNKACLYEFFANKLGLSIDRYEEYFNYTSYLKKPFKEVNKRMKVIYKQNQEEMKKALLSLKRTIIYNYQVNS